MLQGEPKPKRIVGVCAVCGAAHATLYRGRCLGCALDAADADDARTTVGERAILLGLSVYDTALPQTWVDDVERVTGAYPCGLFVWCYDEAKTFGEPVPLTPAAADLLRRYRGTVPS